MFLPLLNNDFGRTSLFDICVSIQRENGEKSIDIGFKLSVIGINIAKNKLRTHDDEGY